MTIRVLVVDDQAMFRDALALLLDAPTDLEVVGQATNGRDAIERCEALQPDVVVMDVRMPIMDGIEATRHIVGPSHNDAGTRPRVLILTTFDLDEHVYAALRAGASGFLLKDSSSEQLASAVRTIAAGDALLAPSTTRRLMQQFARQRKAEPASSVDRLTAREHDVLILIAQGFSNAEIADELILATETIKTHVGRILNKLDLRDRTQAAIYAWENDVVTRT